MRAMMTFFAAVLSTIAVGVLLVAYGLLNPRMSPRDEVSLQTAPANQRAVPAMWDGTTPAMPRPAAYAADGSPLYDARSLNDIWAASNARVLNGPQPIQAVERYQPASYQPRPVRVQRTPSRDWVKTAMVIGGSTAAGAGIGGLIGGKKGALIGAALGGGASTIFEVQKR